MAVNETSGVVGQGRSSFFGRLKTDFLPKWDDHVHKKTVVAEMIAKKGGTMGGYESLGSVMDSLPQMAGVALFEGATLSDPTVGTYFQPRLHARSLYSRLRWTGHVERAARKGDKVAWSRPREEDIKAADEQFRLNFARMLYLGPYQPLATVKSFATATATLYGRDDRLSGLDNLWKFGAHYLRKNMDVQYVNASGGAVQLTGNVEPNTASGVITAIDNSDPSNPTFTFGNPSATDPNDEALVIPAGSRFIASTPTDDPGTDVTKYAGVNGLMQMVTDETIYSKLYDLDRATYTSLNGLRNKSAGGTARPFEEDYLTLAVDRIADEGTGDEPDNVLCDRSGRREYLKESKGDRRFKEVQTEKGFGQLTFHAGDAMLPIKTDRDCPPGIFFVLKASDFKWLEESPMGPIDDGDRFVANADAHEVIIHKSGNVFTPKPHNNGTVEDIDFRLRAVL